MTAGDPGADVARTLLALAREELDLIESGRLDDLEALGERRDAAIARLPRRPSPAARALLAEAVDAQRQVAAALQLGMVRLRDELGRIGQGRTAMAGYAPAGLDARPVLDQSA